MNANDYVRLAMRTNADQEKIRRRIYDLGPTATQLDNAVRGLTDEVGEVASVVKKWLEYGQPLNVTKLNEELGDCCWRISQACDAVGLSFDDILKANIEKLKIRYPEAYSDYRAADENRDRERETAAVSDRDWRKRDQQEKDSLKAMLLRKLDGCFCDSHDGPHPGKECLVCEAVREVLKDLEPKETVRVEQDGHGFEHKLFTPKIDNLPP